MFNQAVNAIPIASAEELSDVSCQEKCRNQNRRKPYQQPTQVDRSRRLRRAGEPFLRNSANQLGVTLGDALPGTIWYLAAAKDCGGTV